MDAIKAFFQFLVDLFSALSTFLTGESGTFNLGDLFGGLSDDETADPAEEG